MYPCTPYAIVVLRASWRLKLNAALQWWNDVYPWFRWLPINGLDMNKRSEEINFNWNKSRTIGAVKRSVRKFVQSQTAASFTCAHPSAPPPHARKIATRWRWLSPSCLVEVPGKHCTGCRGGPHYLSGHGDEMKIVNSVWNPTPVLLINNSRKVPNSLHLLYSLLFYS
jgi:hypothetical protein